MSSFIPPLRIGNVRQIHQGVSTCPGCVRGTKKWYRDLTTATTQSPASFSRKAQSQTIYNENGNNSNDELKVAVLPTNVIQRIAAGEVIHDFTTVVQELVENSLDAQSKNIHVDVDIEERCITARDDGHGINTVGDFQRIALANSTSKLNNLAQLDAGICTLGFRGQALWAIATTAQSLRVSSRPRSKHHGISASFGPDGHPIPASISPVAMSCGTIVVAEQLPWIVSPTRRAQMFRRCRQWLLHTSLCHPQVSFRLTRSGRPAWTAIGNVSHPEEATSLEDNSALIVRLLAREYAANVSDFRQSVTALESVGRLVIVIGVPSTVHSSSNISVVTSVNGRCVRLDSVSRVITSTCSLKRGRYPVAFVGLYTDPANVNWNVCPLKTRMKFHDDAFESHVAHIVARQLDNLLRPMPPGVSTGHYIHTLQQPTTSVSKLLTALYNKSGREVPTVEGRRAAKDESLVAMSPNPMFGANVVAQVLNTYILVEHSGGIMLIEQHVADERVIFERLRDSWSTQAFINIKDAIQLPDTVSEEIVFRLSSLGFEVAPMDDKDGIKTESSSYFVHTVPEAMKSVPKQQLQNMILQLGADDVTTEEAAAAVACRMAVKNGSALDDKTMKSIVQNLFACSNAHTCPHGRPIFHQIDTKELAGLFGRSWTPERIVGRNANEHSSMVQNHDFVRRDFVYGVLDD